MEPKKIRKVKAKTRKSMEKLASKILCNDWNPDEDMAGQVAEAAEDLAKLVFRYLGGN